MISGLWGADSGWDRSPSEVGSFPAGSRPVPRFPSPRALGPGSSGLSGRLIAGCSFTPPRPNVESNHPVRTVRAAPSPPALPNRTPRPLRLRSAPPARWGQYSQPADPALPYSPARLPVRHAHRTRSLTLRGPREELRRRRRLASLRTPPLLRPDRGSGVAIEQRAGARRRESPPGSADRDREPTPPSRDQDCRSRGSARGARGVGRNPALSGRCRIPLSLSSFT